MPTTDSNENSFRNVAVVRFAAIGDVAMTIPVIYSACLCHPGVNFLMVTRKELTGLFINHPKNFSVLGVDIANDYPGIGGMWNLASDLIKEHNVDALIDIQDSLRTKVLKQGCNLRGVKCVAFNKGSKHKNALTRKNNKIMLPLPTSRDRYRSAFHAIGLPLEWKFEGLYGKDGKAEVEDFAQICPPKKEDEKWVGIAPFSPHKGKTYPLEKMEEVVKKLSQQPNVKIFLLGSSGEEARQLEQWEKKYQDKVISLAGKDYGFSAELALMSHMDVVLAMDSANMHMAAICGTNVVSLWGATHPYCGFKAWRQNDTDTIQLAMTCRPCSVIGNKPCHRGDYLCLTGIAPSMIIEKLQQYL